MVKYLMQIILYCLFQSVYNYISVPFHLVRDAYSSKSVPEFGVKSKADIIVIGTQTIRLIDYKGISAAEAFLKSLR